MSGSSSSESDTANDTPITYPGTPASCAGKYLPCPHQGCEKSFNRQSRLKEHLRSHTNERPFECLDCEKTFLRDSHLKHHVKSAHTNQRDYPCTVIHCDKKFATGTRLRRHEESHKIKEQYTCKGFQDCCQTFRKHATLSRHILIAHENKKPFPCASKDPQTGDFCTSAFDTAEKLRLHRSAIHDQPRFVCTVCTTLDGIHGQTTFATYTLLRNHVAEAHPPTCTQCNIECLSERELRRHLELVHNVTDSEGERKRPEFPCSFPECKRSFTKRGNLNVHVKTVHEQRKDFTCGATPLNLLPLLPPPRRQEQEQNIDSEDREIIGCGRRFTSKATLAEHVRTIHLGVASKRQEQNKKRRRAEINETALNQLPTSKRIKKKGSSRTSTIAQLSGFAQAILSSQSQPCLIGDDTVDTGRDRPRSDSLDNETYSPNLFGSRAEHQYYSGSHLPFAESDYDNSWGLDGVDF